MEDEDFIYTASNFLGWAVASGWKPNVLPVGVVYTFQSPVTRALAERKDQFAENTDLTVSNARMFMTDDGGAPILVACLNPGAASMTTQMEYLRYLSGVKALRADGISDAFLFSHGPRGGDVEERDRGGG